jgi:hypothetical protein
MEFFDYHLLTTCKSTQGTLSIVMTGDRTIDSIVFIYSLQRMIHVPWKLQRLTVVISMARESSFGGNITQSIIRSEY